MMSINIFTRTWTSQYLIKPIYNVMKYKNKAKVNLVSKLLILLLFLGACFEVNVFESTAI